MKNLDKVVKSAITAALALVTAGSLVANADTAPQQKTERCYGIAKAGMNDCPTATDACAGAAKKDNQPDAFILLPKGTCNKIVGGSLTPKTDSQGK